MRGTIRKRAKNSWTIVIDLERDATGKRRQKWITVRGTKKQAEAKLAEVVHQSETGSYVSPTKLSLGAFLARWIKDYAVTNVRPRTLEGYSDIINAHLIPKLGAIPLSQLNGSHLQGYYSDALLSGRSDGTGGLSPRSVLHHHRVLREALGHAVKWGLLGRNVADSVDPPRPEKKEMNTLDSNGVSRLLEAARDTLYFPFLHLAIFTGLRRSELLALRWVDVDLERATLSVVRVVHRIRGEGLVHQPPKTNKSRRQVELAPQTVLSLMAHRERQEAECAALGIDWGIESVVFSRWDGSPMRPDTVTHAFANVARKAGLMGIRLHDLRHTHASLMLKANVHPKIVSKRLGHASVAITLDTYSHVSPTLQAAAALQFEEVVDSPQSKNFVSTT